MHVEAGMVGLDAVLVLVGYAALYGSGCTGRPRLDLRLLPLAFLVGFALMGVVLSLSLLAGFDPSVPHVVIAAAVVCALALLTRRRVPEWELLRAPGLRIVPLLGIVASRAAGLRRANASGLVLRAGAALLGCAVAGLLVVGLGNGLGHLLDALAIVACLAAALGRRRLLGADRGQLLRGGLAGAGAAALALAALVALIGALKGEWPSEWDSWNFWVPKAETIYYWHGLDTGIGGWGSISHPEYPPLLAVMYAASFHFAGGFHPSVLPMQNTLLAIAFIGGVLALLDRVAPRWLSFPFLALLAVTPGFFSRTQTLMADPALAYMVAAGAVACLLWLSSRESRWLAFGVLFLAAATLTKLEGLDLALLVVVVVVVASRFGRPGRRRLGLVLLLGPAVIVPWRLWLSAHGLPTSSIDYHASELFHPSFLAHRLYRLTAALEWLRHSVFRTNQWLVTLPLALAGAAVAARRAPAATAATLAWLGLGFFGLAVTYWIGIPNLEYYLSTSADRVSSTLVIVAGTLAPLLLGLSLTRTAPADSDLQRR